MSSFNKIILLGNLTRDPQLKQLASGTSVCEFGIACNRKYKTADGEAREEVAFVDCASFGKQAEILGQFLIKGKPILIEGHLKFDSWEDKNGGGKRSKLSVVIENFQFIGSRGDSPGDGDDQAERSPSRQQQPSQQQQRPTNRAPAARPQPAGVSAPFGDEQHFKDDDIPF